MTTSSREPTSAWLTYRIATATSPAGGVAMSALTQSRIAVW